MGPARVQLEVTSRDPLDPSSHTEEEAEAQERDVYMRGTANPSRSSSASSRPSRPSPAGHGVGLPPPPDTAKLQPRQNLQDLQTHPDPVMMHGSQPLIKASGEALESSGRACTRR